VAKRILPIARELGVAVLEAAAHSAAAAAALVMDPLAVAFEHYHAALAVCEQSEMPRPAALFDLDTYCLTLTIGGIMHADAGHVAKARELLRRANERAEQLDHPFSRAQCLAMAVTAEGQLRDFAAARAWALRALPVARERGFRTTQAMAVVMSAWSNDSESAVDEMKRSVEEAEEGGVGNMSAVRLELAVVLTEAGRYDEARQELATVAEREEPFGERNYRTIRLTSEAEIAFRTGDIESAESLASEAQVDAQERGLVIHDLHAQLVLARVALARGEQTRARELLETIRAQLADEPAIPLSTEAEALLATLA
jgi:tetratricopeptide (TPR) repeat protein